MRIDKGFRAAYRELEARMKILAEADGDVFLPNPEPLGPVEYVFVCMEPSLGRWARSADEARSKVEAGFRNFLSSIEDFLLHFCIQQYLCAPTQRYHITDLSKGAMLVARAGSRGPNGMTGGMGCSWQSWTSLLRQERKSLLSAMPSPNISRDACSRGLSRK
jgi:hypothetical protein